MSKNKFAGMSDEQIAQDIERMQREHRQYGTRYDELWDERERHQPSSWS